MSAVRATATRFIQADGLKFFYREAGPRTAPVLLLLHGFPSSSFQYRHLLNSSLADKYRLIAPDLPGFGFTDVPAEREYKFTFDNLAKSVTAFVDALGLTKYSLYLFDYGAPVGLRLAVARPWAIMAIISQNGNAFDEGLGAIWSRVKELWADPSEKKREDFAFLVPTSVEAFRGKYTTGEREPERIAPEAWHLDHALIQRAGQLDTQLDLWCDYGTNVTLYPTFHEYFAKHQPPVLAVWGKNDPIFIPAGAEAFKRVVPSAQVELLDAGHFALENHSEQIISLIEGFFAENKI